MSKNELKRLHLNRKKKYMDPGIVIIDQLDFQLGLVAIRLIGREGKDEVFVGRIRKDESQENGLNLWIVARFHLQIFHMVSIL